MNEQKRCCLQLNMLPVNALNSVGGSDAGMVKVHFMHTKQLQ